MKSLSKIQNTFQYGLNSILLAHFLAQIGHESGFVLKERKLILHYNFRFA
jgi:predicted chitinase